MDAQSFKVSHQYQTQRLLRLSLPPETCSTAVKVNIRNVYYLSCYPYSRNLCTWVICVLQFKQWMYVSDAF